MFESKQIEAAIARLPTLASAEIRDLQARALERSLDTLAAACIAELEQRPFDFSAQTAADHEQSAAQVANMTLVDTIRHAFTKAKRLSPEEISVLKWIAANPGGLFQDALAAHGKGDLALVVGHLVYDRFGCFRRFMASGEDQSSVLIEKDRTGGSVRYTLRPETATILEELGLV